MIPKIIHFMWLDKKNPYVRGFPDKYRTYLSGWVRMNPDWKVVVWNYEDIESEFPEYMDTFNKIPEWISKCDFARFLVVMKYGGVYIDMDFVPNRPFDDRVTDRSILLISEPREHVEFHKFPGLILNGLFGAEPMHPFMVGWVDQMVKNVNKVRKEWKVMNIIGPGGLYQYYIQNWSDKIPLYSEDTCLFTPVLQPAIAKLKSSPCNVVESYCYTKWFEGSGWGDGKNINILKFLIILTIIITLLYIFYRKYKVKKYSYH